MRNQLIGFSKTYDMVFNTILHGFYYHFTPASAVNVCYRRSQPRLTGGVVLDEFVAFTTSFGSSTYHTQSPNHNLTPITTQPDLTSPSTITHPPPNHPRPSQPHTPSYSHPHPDIPSIYPFIHLSYTLTRSIVNKLLTLYIYYIFLLTY